MRRVNLAAKVEAAHGDNVDHLETCSGACLAPFLLRKYLVVVDCKVHSKAVALEQG